VLSVVDEGVGSGMMVDGSLRLIKNQLAVALRPIIIVKLLIECEVSVKGIPGLIALTWMRVLLCKRGGDA